MQHDVLSYISDLTGAEIGQLSESESITVQLAPSSSGEKYLDGSGSDNISLLFLCKNKNQQSALKSLEQICSHLTHIKKHSHEIYNLYVATQPNYVDHVGDFWIYSCIINFKYYNKEVF